MGVSSGWRGDALVYEERREPAGAGSGAGERRTIRTYPTAPGALVPFAQREAAEGQPAGPSEHLLTGPTGQPVAVVRGDGGAVREVGGGVYGQLPPEQTGATAVRFVGHWYDDETGLHYNRHRYYDPETGAYLSAEPLGLEGSLKAYAYTDGYPVDVVDINGLNPAETILTRTGGNDINAFSGQSQGAGATNYVPKDAVTSQKLHPAVVAALPPTNARNEGRGGGPEKCAEPMALSRHLYDWEKKNKPKRCNPPDKDWQSHLGSALDQVTGISSRAEKGKGESLNACPNCGQTIPRLWALAGKPPPNGIYKGGVDNPEPAGWLKDDANKKQNNYVDTRDPKNPKPVVFQDKEGKPIEPGRFDYNDKKGGWSPT